MNIYYPRNKGIGQNAYLAEFIPTPSAAELEDEEVVTDETEGLMDFGELKTKYFYVIIL